MKTITRAFLPVSAAYLVSTVAQASDSDHSLEVSRLQLAAMTQEGSETLKNDESTRTAANTLKSDGEKRQRKVIEEVVVTAQKRAENVLDVPISMTAITAGEIDRRGFINSADYLRGIPGVNQVDVGTGLAQTIVIRGVETSPANQNSGAGVTTATYFGETPTTTSSGLSGGTNVDLALVDIERVEVLRGPQGTAFGSSSMGGTVRTIPVAPKLEEFEAKVGLGYSSTSRAGGDNYSFHAVGNIPLIQSKLAIRAVAYQDQDSGFYRNRAGSDAAFQSAVTPSGAQPFAVDDEEVGSYLGIGGRIAILFQATDKLGFNLGYLSQKTETDGYPGSNSGTYEQILLRIAPEQVIRGQSGGYSDTNIDIANATMEYNFGWANLTATYSYVEGGTHIAIPGVFGATVPVSFAGPSEHRANIGEVRLATQLEGAWQFLGGLYVEDLKDAGLFSYRTYGAVDEILGEFRDRRHLEQQAAFGEASWQFLPGFTLTGGIRAYEYDRNIRTNTTGLFAQPESIRKTNTSGTSFRGNLSYKPNENGMLYAGWAQGFRLGKPHVGLPGTCDTDNDGIVDGTEVSMESTRKLDSDEIDNYEIGGKFALLERRLTIDAAVFRMDWSKLPVDVVAPECRLGYLANVGRARSDGVELQMSFQLAEPFRVDLGGSWLDARITKGVPSQGIVSGDPLPGSPEVNANLGLQYDFKIGDHNASVRADSIYVGSFYGNILQSPTTKSGDYVKIDVSSRLQIRAFNIDFFVHNVTNEDAFSFRGAFPGPSEFFGWRLRPRTVGVQLGYDF